jgi:hypothetical protein
VVRLLPQMNSTAPRLHGSTAPRLHGSTAPRLHGSTAPRLHGSTAPRLHGSTANRRRRFGRSAVASRNNGDVFWIHRGVSCGDSRARRDDGRARGDHRSAPLGHRRIWPELPSHTREGSQGVRQPFQRRLASSGRTRTSSQRTLGWSTGIRRSSQGARGTSTGAVLPPQDAARTWKCAPKTLRHDILR